MHRSALPMPFTIAGLAFLLGGCGEAEVEDAELAEAPLLGRADVGGVIPGQYIVMLRPGMPLGTLDAVEQGLLRPLAAAVHHRYDSALLGFAASLSPQAVARLRSEPGVELVEPDREVSITATQQNPPSWGLDRIDQRTLPLSRGYSYARTGKGVDAYIIDTGVRRTHRDFGGRAQHGFSSINDGRGSSDCNGHGTHVAGTVGGATYGVAKEVTIWAVRVLSCSGSGSDSGVIAGVDWVTRHHQSPQQSSRPAVANMSLGGGASTSLDRAVQNSIRAGVTYVLAAGNEGRSACYVSPARVREAITVGATGSYDSRSGYSNYGPCVDIFAPGTGIRSAWGSGDTAAVSISGTSMAAPHVAGAAALYLMAHPRATPAEVDAGLRNAATTNRLTNIGTGSPNRLLYTGP
jgi:subtilisin family serine protease